MKARLWISLLVITVLLSACQGSDSGSWSRHSVLIDQELSKLPIGEVYHNVPDEMQAGVNETIEAGITPQVTQEIIDEIKGREELTIILGKPFDPMGTKMTLVVKPDEFKVYEVKGNKDKQFVTQKTPGKWIWDVTPLKAGNRRIVVKATVDLKVPELNVTRPVEVEVFSDIREVKVNWAYSTYELLSKNWKEVVGFVVGSGSLAGLVGWWIGGRKRSKAA